jgi:signal peptidase
MLLRTLKRVSAALLLVAIIAMSGLAIFTRAQGGRLLSVQTKSMVPVLNKGDLVSVIRVPAENLKVGDIITFINPRNSKQTITHRITELPSAYNAKKIVTKGDANQSTDVPIDQSAVLGRVSYAVPYAGYASDFIRQPLGLIILIYVPALAIIIGELKRLSAYYKSQVYVVPGRKPSKFDIDADPVSAANALGKLVPICIIAFLAIVAVPVQADLRSQARLTGNKITASRLDVPPSGCSSSGNVSSTSITVNGSSSHNTVTINTSTNQTTESGDATTSGNTNGGSATSGSASNCSSSNISVVVQ